MRVYVDRFKNHSASLGHRQRITSEICQVCVLNSNQVSSNYVTRIIMALIPGLSPGFGKAQENSVISFIVPSPFKLLLVGLALRATFDTL